MHQILRARKNLIPFINVTYGQKQIILVILGIAYYRLDQPVQAIFVFKGLPALVSSE